jgi:hypothetical protein
VTAPEFKRWLCALRVRFWKLAKKHLGKHLYMSYKEETRRGSP